MYPIGKNRIYYQVHNFDCAEVTCLFHGPGMSTSETYHFSKLEDGVYYLDFTFTSIGDYIGIFYEDGERKATHVFKVYRSGNMWYEGIPIN